MLRTVALSSSHTARGRPPARSSTHQLGKVAGFTESLTFRRRFSTSWPTGATRRQRSAAELQLLRVAVAVERAPQKSSNINTTGKWRPRATPLCSHRPTRVCTQRSQSACTISPPPPRSLPPPYTTSLLQRRVIPGPPARGKRDLHHPADKRVFICSFPPRERSARRSGQLSASLARKCLGFMIRALR